MGNCCSDRNQDEDGLQLTRITTEPKRKQEQRARTWATTGIVGLRDGNLKELPKAIASIAACVRNLDAANNQLTQFPFVIQDMPQLQRLVLSENRISSFTVSLSKLTKLKVLVLDNNVLSALPDDIGDCVQLEQLSLARNGLTALPASVGALSKLKSLCVADNSLQALPPRLAGCSALEVLDVARNRLEAVPPELSELRKLNTLNLSGNHVASVPSAVLQKCTMLQTLLVHDNPITQEMLEETEGFQEFEKRRQDKYTKTIAGGALINNSGLDTGVDVPT